MDIAQIALGHTYEKQGGKAFETRKKEHVRNEKNYRDSSNIASHAWENGHKVDFENGEIIDEGNFRT